MTITVTPKGTAQGASGWAQLTGLSFSVGSDVVICVASDTGVDTTIMGAVTLGKEPGVTYALESTHCLVRATNSGNVVAEIFLVQNLTADDVANIDNVTVWLPVGENGAFSVYQVTGLATSSPYDKGATSTGSSSSPSSGATQTLSQADELIIGIVGTEGPDGDTAGSWTTGTSNVSGNEQRLGTTGGGAAGNITISTAAEVVSATTAQTAAKTGITSRDWAALVATFKAVVPFSLPSISLTRRLMHLLIR